jgi:small conductance mechanosensitive channel
MFWQDFGAELRRRLLTPEQFANYLTKAISIVIIIAAALLIHTIARSIIRRILHRDGRLAHERRARTLVAVSRSLAGYTIFFVALVMCLRVLGVDYTAILAGAGVVGLAVGFGAQTLIRDFISGFFLLLEDLVSVGDWISVGEVSGFVEAVGLRITRVRGFDGTLHVIPNGELTRFGNANRGFMRALVAVDIAYEQDPAKGMAIAEQVAQQWAAERQEIVVEPPQVQGIVAFGESSIRIRVVVKVKPMEHWQAERELRNRLKAAFDSSGVEIPFPRRVIYSRGDKQER